LPGETPAATATATDNLLEELERRPSSAEKCSLAKTRTQVVYGVGNPKADLMFIARRPGRDEDLQGSRSSAGPASSSPTSSRP